METRELILNKASKLYYKYGIRSVTMDDLARKLGVSKKTIYKEFENKEEIIEEILESLGQTFCKRVCRINTDSENAVIQMYRISTKAFQMVNQVSQNTLYDLKKYYGLTYRAWLDEVNEFMRLGVEQNIRKGIKEGLFRSDINVEFVTHLYLMRANYFSGDEALNNVDFSLEVLFWESLDIYVRGISTKKGEQIWEEYYKEKQEV